MLGKIGPPNYRKTVELADWAAANGEPGRGNYLAGQAFVQEKNPERDEGKARDRYLASVKHGFGDAAFRLGAMAYWGKPPNEEQGKQWFEKALALGTEQFRGEAHYGLYRYYVTRDRHNEAWPHAKAGAEVGHAWSMWSYGMYLGQGTYKDGVWTRHGYINTSGRYVAGDAFDKQAVREGLAWIARARELARQSGDEALRRDCEVVAADWGFPF